MEGRRIMKLELAKYLAKWKFKTYEYGDVDCMLFIVDWNDIRSTTNEAQYIRNKYHSKREAIVFYKNYLSVEGWLAAQGYEARAASSHLRDGDLVQTGDLNWPLVWIAFDNNLYHMSENGLVFAKRSALAIQKIWRK